MNSAIATVFSFCSNDWRFFERCIQEARVFSQQILVTVCDHFFDGSAENYALLEKVYSDYPDVLFLEFAYDPNYSYNCYTRLNPDHLLWRHEWHNTGRWLSYFFVDDQIEYLYFCDGDEVTDGKRFWQWLQTQSYRAYNAMRISCYWYFRQARYRALEEDDMSLLIKKKAIEPQHFWNEHERMGLYLSAFGNKALHVKGVDDRPLVHHYSWVRTQQELEKKFATWGHFWERDWKRLVEQEFAKAFNGVDFIRKYHYVEEACAFDPLDLEVPSLQPVDLQEHISNVKLFDNVHRVCRQEMFRKELQHLFFL